MTAYPNLLVTDFDGTITRHDFYELALDRVVRTAVSPDYWALYSAGKITHFEAMRGIFSWIRCGEEAIREIIRGMDADPNLKPGVERLRASGWDVIVVSAGSSWYIRQVLDAAGVSLEVHASPGHFTPSQGLLLEPPVDSPYYCPRMGIDKEAVVLQALRRYRRVAFAGNGPPDVEPALKVDPALRFARTFLAGELARRGEVFHRFDRWSEIADRLLHI